MRDGRCFCRVIGDSSSGRKAIGAFGCQAIETSLAAREVAAQIVSVSNEPIETSRRASEIRDGSAEIASKVDETRATLVRVIRTSTTDVDRRISSRIDIRRPGTLKLQGSSGRVVVQDISVGGATIDEALPNTSVDAPMTLGMVKFKLSDQSSRTVNEFVSTQ
jgi:hypothetical protein